MSAGMYTPLQHQKLHPLITFIRSCKTVCLEIKNFLEILVVLAVGVWGFLHVVQVLFGSAR